MNERQARFVAEYLIDLNITQAAIRAGYAPKNAGQAGHRLYTNVEIQEAITKARNETMENLNITKERVLAEYAKIAFADPSKFFKSTPEGDPYIDASGATPDDWAAVQSVQSEEYTEGRGENGRDIRKSKITLADKKSALDSIAKHLGMFTEQINHSGGIHVTWEGEDLADAPSDD